MRQARLTASIVALALLAVTAAYVLAIPKVLTGEGMEMRAAVRARTMSSARSSADWTPAAEAPPAPGWQKEKALSAKNNDWEPSVATAPGSPDVYILTTRYGAFKSCNQCRHSGLWLNHSTDNGATWDKGDWILGPGGWQADPQIATDDAGDLFAAVLTAPYVVDFMKSTDQGATWSVPKKVIGTLPWADHPWITVSGDGMDVYLGFNHHQNYQTSSHDGGATWNEPVLTGDLNDDGYYFAVGATILPDDSIVFADAEYGCCPYNDLAHKRPIMMKSIRSIDGGDTWTETLVDTVAAPPECTSYRCPPAMYGGQPSVSSDAAGTVMFVYSGGFTKFGNEQIWERTSADGGVTWSAATALSPTGVKIAGFPQVVGGVAGDFRVMWMDSRNGIGRFNTYYRETTDGGTTWSADARLSNVGGGPVYKHPTGYQFYYGDYGEIDITNTGKTIAVWSESNNYWGPGNTWYSVQT